MRRLLGIAAIIVVAVGAGSARQQRPTFRSTSDAVLVEVSVTDGRSSVASLTPADFQVTDNGVRQTVTDLDYGRLPIDVRMVFDVSGSVSDADLARFERAMTELGAALHSGDRCEVSAFARRATDVTSLSDPPVDPHVTRTGPDGTAFFDAVSMAMITTPRPGRRQLTIILSDGNDTSSFFDDAALMRAAQRTDAVVYAIAPAGPTALGTTLSLSTTAPGRMVMTSGPVLATGPASSAGARLLDNLAKATGGRLMTLGGGDLAASFLKALDEFRQSYVLHYTPAGVDRGGWHELAVTVNGKKKYTIRAKQGYDGGAP